MPPYVTALIGWTVLICSVELLMWTLFRVKVSGICFEAAASDAPRSSFTIFWLRFIAIGHTIIMLAVITLFHYLLW